MSLWGGVCTNELDYSSVRWHKASIIDRESRDSQIPSTGYESKWHKVMASDADTLADSTMANTKVESSIQERSKGLK